VTVQCESSACLLGNEGEIESIVSNLLSNAIRHTRRDGAIALSWRLIDDGAKLTVSDTGEGISDDHIPRLTERFFRVDTGRSRQEGGIGLGLAIVKHALLRHDGQLDIDSALGKGSTFTCRFPSSRVAKGRVDQLAVGE
jgi:two-component system phosphate regulon sensor histidine kinase PhoR